MKKIFISVLVIALFSVANIYGNTPDFSTAGFFALEGSPRTVENFNVGWRFFLGEVQNGHTTKYDDQTWEIVNLPNGLENLPEEASGCINYQGEAWYRKYFTVDEAYSDKKIFIHFEAIMGYSKIWVNGQLLKEHFGGYLPIVLDVSDVIKKGEKNIIAVMADNSNNGNYPPGKPQEGLDFTYFGGIYRDSWLITTNKIHVTNANHSDKVAGGGTFVHVNEATELNASITVKSEIDNESSYSAKITISHKILDTAGRTVAEGSQNQNIKKNKHIENTISLQFNSPSLWTPDKPYLYELYTTIYNSNGETLDAFKQKIGIRTIDFKGVDGFYLNGKPYEGKLLGGNRHQDFAIIGNALPNSLHWKDAKKLRDAGFTIIRAAHYPMDPAFMDACNELGLFVIVATPGWQWFVDSEEFKDRVFSDIRQMVRRDRNHPSVIMWEPILNESRYDEDFGKRAHDIVHEEYPYQGAFTVSDEHLPGSKYYDVLYGFPGKLKKTERCLFTREWGDNVCDFIAHNSTSRVSREWGERPMLHQATHYSKPREYNFLSLETFHHDKPQHFGAALWHSFDHQRGYHHDPFYGGIMDAYRQPKISYDMFVAQRDPRKTHPIADHGPFLKIAHDMNPFSPTEVTVYSNCDSVKLVFAEKDTAVIARKDLNYRQPHPPFRFVNMYNFMDVKYLHRKGERIPEIHNKASLQAFGYLDGEVILKDTRYMVEELHRVILMVDNEDLDLVADGSDIITVIAACVDERGEIKRLNNRFIQFEIEGEGEIIGSEVLGINPHKIEWGTAPILVRSTNTAGKIRIKAKCVFGGMVQPIAGEIVINSIPSTQKMNYIDLPKKTSKDVSAKSLELEDLQQKYDELKLQYQKLKAKEVNAEQNKFEVERK